MRQLVHLRQQPLQTSCASPSTGELASSRSSHADILRLPAEERARLAHELIRSLDGEPEAGAAKAWDDEIERRGAEVDCGVADTMTFDEYRAHIRQRRVARANR
jgi:putative addiction module component (TIGR02574 family)